MFVYVYFDDGFSRFATDGVIQSHISIRTNQILLCVTNILLFKSLPPTMSCDLQLHDRITDAKEDLFVFLHLQRLRGKVKVK